MKDWITRTKWGHVVFFEAVFSLPFAVYGIASNYQRGTLSVRLLIEILVGLTLLGAVGALAIWYAITSPHMGGPKK